jgi:S-adenosyl-L-methionine hydrolase (adenosine-forming)
LPILPLYFVDKQLLITHGMSIVTLTTDWGRSNHYAAAVKGTLLKLISGVTIVDISHDIPPFDIMQAAFVIKNAYEHFPEGTIHIVGINSEAGIETPHIVVKHQGHFFVGADNGIFSLLFDNNPDEAVEIDMHQDSDYFTFSSRDVFSKVAAMLASGNAMKTIGSPHAALNHKIAFKPVVYPEKIVGKVIFVDSYENVFVNIDKNLFRTHGKNRPFSISFRSVGNHITQIHQAYSDVVPGERLALFGTTSFLEIAINQGKASGLLGLNINDTVSIDFFTHE